MANEHDYETGLTFRKCNHFWEQLNKKMVIKDRDTLNDSPYHLLLFSNLPTDFNNCVDEYGCLKTSGYPVAMELITEGYTDKEFHIGVEWINNGESGFNLFLDEWNDGGTAEEHEQVDVDIPIDEETVLWIKGVALAKTTGTNGGNEYIVAYARLSTKIKAQNYISLMGGSYFVSHTNCEVQ